MELLTLLLIPAAFLYYSAGNRFSNLPTYRIAYATGLFCSIVLVLFDYLISDLFPWNTQYFAALYGIYLFSVLLVPFVLGPALLNAVFLADAHDRINRTIPQLYGIASIYLPYSILHRFPENDVWIHVVFPILIVSLLFLADICLKRYVNSIKRYPSFSGVLFALLPVFVVLLAVPLLMVLWYFCFHPFAYWLPSVAVVLFTCWLRLRKYL